MYERRGANICSWMRRLSRHRNQNYFTMYRGSHAPYSLASNFTMGISAYRTGCGYFPSPMTFATRGWPLLLICRNSVEDHPFVCILFACKKGAHTAVGESERVLHVCLYLLIHFIEQKQQRIAAMLSVIPTPPVYMRSIRQVVFVLTY